MVGLRENKEDAHCNALDEQRLSASMVAGFAYLLIRLTIHVVFELW